MSFFTEYLSESLIAIGIALLVIEVAILGFATFVLLFMGLSLVLTGVLMLVGVLDSTYITALWSNTIVTGVLAALLWKPLKQSQNKTSGEKTISNTIQHEFVLEADTNNQSQGTHKYSGIQWKVKSQQPINQGTLVKVVKADVGVLWVEEVSE